ncbi:MAG: TonB-dependent receptor [Mangrovibacterium sp.]
MKLTSVFCLMGLLQVSATVYSQQTKLSLTANNMTVRKVIDQIEEQSNFKFLYRDEVIDADRRVTVEIRGNIEEILKEIFAGTDVSYRFLENNLIALTNPSEQEQIKISGKVTESSGVPLPGVSVVIRNTTQGTITGANGDYVISNIPADAILVFSFVGMRTQEIPVSGKTRINVVLEEESFGIEEVVAVGYGTQKKVNLTGAVSQVGSEVLESRAITSIGQGLQGVVPNLNITFSNGSPNTSPSVNVRGGTSFSGSSFTKGSPLILVDGFESSDMNLLNPEDIESISVLKDASSAAIYGARAAYGVMLITTKQGKKGERVKVSYNSSFQLSKPVAIPDLLDSYTMQFAQNKAKELAGQSPSASDVNKLQWMREYMDHPETAPVYKTDGNSITWVGNTDVYGEAVRNWTPFQKHAVNVSGGSEKINYYASISYQQQEGLYKISTDIHNRYNVLLNLATDVNNWFSVNYKASFNKSDYTEPYNNPGKGGWWYAMGQGGNYNINMPVKAPKDSPVGEMYTDNILSYMGYGSENKEVGETTLLSVAPTFKIAKGLNLKGDFSYESYHYRQKTVVPELENVALTWTPVISPHTTPSWLYKEVDHQDKFALNIYGDFTQTFFEKHHIYALAGFNQEWMRYNELWSKGTDLLTSSLPVISQTLGTKTTDDSESEWAIRGAFCRLNYNYNEKYLFEFNGRYDGTSKFPTDSRFKFFPSFSAGWRISEENFAGNIRSVVNNFKIRASYGSLGNQNVANYIYFPSYGTISKINYVFNSIRPMGITPPGLVSPSLTWETATTIDFGFDLSLWNKFDFSFDWYNRTTSDILVAGDQYPALLGTSAPTKNSGEMKSVGWEITATWRDQLQNGLKYDVSLVLSDYQSEITRFDGNPEKVLSSLYVGQKMGEIWGYETMGLFQSAEEIAEAPSQRKINSGVWYPGDVRYKNLDGDEEIFTGTNTVADPGDRKIIGNSTPRYQFGINMNASWKNFDLNLFFQGVGKRDFWTDDKFYWGQMKLDGTGTWHSYENSWTTEHRDAFFPGYRYFDGNTQVQSRYLQNAAYVRLKNLTFGYTLPVNLTKQIKIEKARVYFSGQNLWERTKVVDTLDPETINGTYPIMRSYALGLQVSF